MEREETEEVGKENEGREYKNVTEGKRVPTKADDESQPDWGWLAKSVHLLIKKKKSADISQKILITLHS